MLDPPEHTPAARWVHRSGDFDLGRPLLMGVLNATPDSFSDGGLHHDPGHAVARAVEMVEQGAGLIDVGGESTRPGSMPVGQAEELARVLPVIRGIRARLDIPISIDTRRAEVAHAALAEGADIVNDVSALGDPRMAGVVVECGAGLVLMHMRGVPATMQRDPRYGDVLGEIAAALEDRLAFARHEGIEASRIVLDPGIGFGKTSAHNLEIIARLAELGTLGRPILLGVSRKAFLGELIGGAPPHERDVATVAACVVGLLNGARIFRVHNVQATGEAIRVAEAIRAPALSHV